VIASHARRVGHYTSEELPRGMSSVPYDLTGDPELGDAFAGEVRAAGSWATAIDNPHLPIHYGTLNLTKYLQSDERWLGVSTVQTGEPDDYLLFGEALGRAVERLDRRVVILASGGMSHRFWPLRELRARESSDPVHIRTAEARAADEERLEWMQSGDHDRIIDTMADFAPFAPEGRFGHYLSMIAAIGGRRSRATGRMLGDYENSIGTGQVHVWFDRPDGGWPLAA
jgi:aromatic ring-opening dioxygenase catalytic subunit (LigB family)